MNLTEEENQMLSERAQYFEKNARNAIATTGSRLLIIFLGTDYTKMCFIFVDNTSTACGLSNRSSQDRIVGGTEAQPHEFPWQAWLLLTSGNSQFACGGSLISNQWILTAAHCVFDR